MDTTFANLEMYLFSIPYLIVTSVGTIIKVLLFSLVSILSFNRLIKFQKIYSKRYMMSSISNPWSLVWAIVTIIVVFRVFKIF